MYFFMPAFFGSTFPDGPTGSSQRFVLFNGVESSPVSTYPNVSVWSPEDGHVGYLFPAWNYLFKQKATPNLLP